MSTTPEQIDLWRSSPSEHQRLEFKEAKLQFDNRKLFRYCVAIANEGGGYLVLGVADKPPRPVVGTAAFNNPVEMAQKLFEALGFRVDIEDVTHPAGRVLVFHVPSRPRGTAYHFDGAYLMRAGEELVPMSEDQLRRIFAEGEPDWLEEHAQQGLDAQDVVGMLDTQAFFDLLKLPYPTERAGVLERLIQERLVDRTGHKRTSALLFAHVDFESMDRNDRIRACYQHCCLRYVTNQKMSNQSLRERFNLPEKKAEPASRTIRETIAAGKIRIADSTQTSLRYRSYVPFWT